ncbi:hypothetical protein [Alicyclobacillus sp. ALC3]|uniref:hypothetical protein n=1 Tax=Alicyclobacillus sp. ALC3 TaxID=2796143 RepID=UPI0023787B08|nr:hypothetical protein [Alicyclobacillus sp. ALC3]WDL97492.1 hypothetical protein JC200_01820 [Alicyclobacillus sp. ALC3]
MTLWQWTFLLALATSAVGLILFGGFTFRIKPRFPFLLVTLHVVGATATVVLFCVLFARWLMHYGPSHAYAGIVLWASLIVILATFLSGLYFYFFYNARRRGLGYRLLVTHLVMAALSFVCIIASVAELSGTGLVKSTLFPTNGYNFHKHAHMQQVGQANMRKS